MNWLFFGILHIVILASDITQQESVLYFAKNFGSQKILLIHAYSFDYPINTSHLYRVLGISNDTATGRISVSGKTLFWIGRFALEFNE